MKIRKQPVVVQAEKFVGDGEAVFALVGKRRFRLVDPADETIDPGVEAQIYDTYHSTWIGVRPGQWIIVGVNGETYPIEEDVLLKTYDILED